MANPESMFDPYYKWLGIPPADQPPNHYRLLGLSPFENDLDVIASAADRQMTHVKSFVSGPYTAQSQKLLDELAKARICLLTPVAKDAYDAGLQQAINASTDSSGILLPGESPAPDNQPAGTGAGPDAWPPGTAVERTKPNQELSRNQAEPLTRPNGNEATDSFGVGSKNLSRNQAEPLTRPSGNEATDSLGVGSKNLSRNQAEPLPRPNGNDAANRFEIDSEKAGRTGARHHARKRQKTRRTHARDRAKQKQNRPRSWTLGYLAFSLVGLAVCCVLLAKLSPRYDLLGLFDHRETSDQGDRMPAEKDRDIDRDPNTDRAPEDPKPTPEYPNAVEIPQEPYPLPGVGLPPEPAPVVVTETPNNPDGSETTPVPNDPAPPVDPFAALPDEVGLPTLEEKQIEIGPIALSEEDIVSLQVLGTDNLRRTMPRFFSRPIELAGDELRWNVYYATDAKREALDAGTEVLDALAEFRLLSGRLSMRWTPAASGTSSWHALQNCLVELTLGQARHLFQLRTAMVGTPVWFEGGNKPVEVRVDLLGLPPTANLFLEVTRLAHFPQLLHNDGNPDKLSGERHAVWTFKNDEYAGISIAWERNRNRLSMKVAPRCQLKSAGTTLIVLSSAELTRRERELQQPLGTGKRELKKRIADRDSGTLNRELMNARRKVFRGRPVADQRPLRNAAVAAVQERIRTNDVRITFLEENLPKLESDLRDRLPRLKKLAGRIESGSDGTAHGEGRRVAEVRFRIYTLAEGRKVFLFTNDRSVGREWDTTTRIVAPAPPLPLPVSKTLPGKSGNRSQAPGNRP